MPPTFNPLPRGVIVPLITPLAEPDRLDVDALERLIERVVTGGVQGLFILGTCGEGASLSGRLQREVISRTTAQVARRAAVVVCASDAAPGESVALAEHAAACGADAVALAPPFYFELTQSELQRYFDDAAHGANLPLVAYNYPALAKTTILPETVDRLIDDPRFGGLKDSSGDMAYFAEVRRLAHRRPEWRLYVGPEQLLVESVRLGGDGGVAGGANLFPDLFVQIYEAAADGADRLPALVARAERLAGIYSCGGGEGASAVRGLKAALASLGLGNGRPAPPLAPASEADQRRVAEIVRSLGA